MVSNNNTLYRGPVGEPGEGLFAGNFEGQEEYIWVPFGPGAIKILNLGVIWNFSKGTGLP